MKEQTMADVTIEQVGMTLEDLLALGEDARVEIIDGELVKKPMTGGEHHIVGGNIYRIVDGHVYVRRIGVVFMDGMTFLMHATGPTLKDSFEPDVSFIFNANVPQGWDIKKPHPGVPDLAVEVVSPGDDAETLQRKRKTYLQKGTKQVWIVYPLTREVHQYTLDGVRLYTGSEAIDAADLFPGIEGLTLDSIFAPPPWA